jgi:hypothetical protein
VGQRGQRKCTGEIENTQKISVGNPERERHFGRSRRRYDVEVNVMNCMYRITITVPSRSAK